MTRGPPPKPKYLRLLKGNPGGRRIHDEPEPVLPPKVPDPPHYVEAAGSIAIDEWYAVAPELYRLRMLTVVDLTLLAGYCIAYARWRDAQDVLAKQKAGDPVMHGLLVRGTQGFPAENPLLRVSRHAAQEMLKLAIEFGMSPAARARIAQGINAPQEQSRFGDLLA